VEYSNGKPATGSTVPEATSNRSFGSRPGGTGSSILVADFQALQACPGV
jgi:hypothetical protein